MRARQLPLLPKLPKLQPEHGGSLRPGKRKTARAIDPKQLIHTVLRSTQARGQWSLLHSKNRAHVDEAARRIARKHGIRLHHYANVGNHLHLLVKTPTRTAFKSFLRELTGVIAIIVTGAKKGNALQKRGEGMRGFWDFLPYTRIVSWGRDLANLKLYFVKNLFEAAGLLTRKAKAAGARVIPVTGWMAAPS
jgi:REP element-mobilizing transposase RayT